MKDFISTFKQIIPFLLLLAAGHFSKKSEWAIPGHAASVPAVSEAFQDSAVRVPTPPQVELTATARAEAVYQFIPDWCCPNKVVYPPAHHQPVADSGSLAAPPYLRGNLLVNQEHFAGAASESTKGNQANSRRQSGNDARRGHAAKSNYSGLTRFNLPDVAR